MRGYFVRLWPAAGQHSGHWTPGVTSVSQESGYIQHQGQGWSGANLKSTSFVLASGECCSAATKMSAKILEFALLCVVMSEAFYSHFIKAI